MSQEVNNKQLNPLDWRKIYVIACRVVECGSNGQCGRKYLRQSGRIEFRYDFPFNHLNIVQRFASTHGRLRITAQMQNVTCYARNISMASIANGKRKCLVDRILVENYNISAELLTNSFLHFNCDTREWFYSYNFVTARGNRFGAFELYTVHVEVDNGEWNHREPCTKRRKKKLRFCFSVVRFPLRILLFFCVQKNEIESRHRELKCSAQ